MTPEDRGLLVRYPLLQNSVVGYISTMYGAGYEYVDQPDARYSTKKSSRRIEDLFWDPPSKLRVGVRTRGAVAVGLGAGNYVFTRTGFKDIVPFEMRGDCRVTLVDVHAESGRWDRRVSLAELHSNRSSEYWSVANAVARAKDELLVALSDIREAERHAVPLPRFLTTLKQRYVLLLGDFSGEGRKRLEAMRSLLNRNQYVAVMLDELPELPEFDLLQKAGVMAHASRFVVIDDSSYAGHLAEVPVVLAARTPAIVLRLEDSSSSFVSKGIAAGTGGRVQELHYTASSLESVLFDAVRKTENWIGETAAELEEAYPWRKEPA